MITQHTPGPWFTLDTGLDVYAEHPQTDPDYLPRRRHIAAAITTCQFDQEARANAALIAAAPDMLAALPEMMSIFADHEQYDEDSATVVAQSRAAITKATT